LLRHQPQFGSVTPVAESRMAQVMGRRPQASDLIRSMLILQLSDLKLQPRNSTLPAVSPMFKGLSLLEEFWWMADLSHLRTNHVHSRWRQFYRKLCLNRVC
jgi:hypothetical protein